MHTYDKDVQPKATNNLFYPDIRYVFFTSYIDTGKIIEKLGIIEPDTYDYSSSKFLNMCSKFIKDDKKGLIILLNGTRTDNDIKYTGEEDTDKPSLIKKNWMILPGWYPNGLCDVWQITNNPGAREIVKKELRKDGMVKRFQEGVDINVYRKQIFMSNYRASSPEPITDPWNYIGLYIRPSQETIGCVYPVKVPLGYIIDSNNPSLETFNLINHPGVNI